VGLQITDRRVTRVALDVTSDSQIQQVARELDSLDVLINNAGILKSVEWTCSRPS
jgi:NAD(P)-dependent dehydrogenase (short-subunit alcohol dehydrogenase family)